MMQLPYSARALPAPDEHLNPSEPMPLDRQEGMAFGTPDGQLAGIDVYRQPVPEVEGYVPQHLPPGYTANLPEPEMEEGEAPTLRETFWNSWQRENDIYAMVKMAEKEKYGAFDRELDVYAMIRDTKYEMYRDLFVEARNEKHVRDLMAQIDKEEEWQKIRERAGWTGFATDMVASIISPTTLMPTGVAVKAARAGRILSGAGRAALAVGASNAAAAALQEGILQQSQLIRTAEESALNVFGAMVLGGVIGGGIGGMSAKRLTDLSRFMADMKVADRAREGLEARLAEMGSSGRLSDFSAVGATDAGAARAGPTQPLELVGTGGVAPMLRKIDPMLDNLQSDIPAIRQGTADLSETVLSFTRNFEGEPTSTKIGGPAERQISIMAHNRIVRMEQMLGDLYGKYRFGQAPSGLSGVGTRVAGGIERMTGRTAKMTKREFNQEVSKAASRGDVHPVPEVAEAAKRIRAEVIKPMEDMLVAQGLLDANAVKASRKATAKAQGKGGEVEPPQPPVNPAIRAVAEDMVRMAERLAGREGAMTPDEMQAAIDILARNPDLVAALGKALREADEVDNLGKGAVAPDDPPFAIAGRDPAGQWEKIGERLAEGEAVEIPQASIRAAEDMVQRARALMPENVRGERVSVITGITPKGDNLQIAIRDVGGDVRSIEGTPVDGRVITVPASGFDAIAGSRFLFNPDTGDILLTGLDTVGDTPASVASGVYHEIAHRLFWAARLSGREQPALERLVDHAESFGILDRQFNDFADSVGLPDRFDDGATIRGEYERLYAGLDDDVRAGNLAEESVAHLVELYHANALTPREMELVRADMEALFGARVDEPFVDDGQGPLLAALRGGWFRSAVERVVGGRRLMKGYHATRNDFDTFDMDKSVDNPAVFFFPDQKSANAWADEVHFMHDGTRIIPVEIDTTGFLEVKINDAYDVDVFSKHIELARKKGKAGVIFRNVMEPNLSDLTGDQIAVIQKGRVKSSTSGDLMFAARGGRRDLDMSPEARKARAEAMGFDTSKRYYHGTAVDVPAFSKLHRGGVTGAKSGRKATWFVESEAVAAGYADLASEKPVADLIKKSERAERQGKWDEAHNLMAEAERLEAEGGRGQNIIPVHLRGRFKEIDMDGMQYDPDDVNLTDIIDEAIAGGFDGVRLVNFSDDATYGTYTPTTHVAVFDPSNIRSVNAAFDPAESASSNLLAAIRSIADRNNAIAIDDMMPGTPHPKGTPVLGFHGTTAEHFQRFDIERSKDIGIHFGTRDQANTFAPAQSIEAEGRWSEVDEIDLELSRAMQANDQARVMELTDRRVAKLKELSKFRENQTARIFPALVDIKNPIDMPDMGEWAPVQMARYLKRQRDIGFTDEDLAQIELLDDSDAYELIRYRLGEAGFDGIRYENRFEGDGYSYIVWNKGQVRSAIVPSDVLYAARGGRRDNAAFDPAESGSSNLLAATRGRRDTPILRKIRQLGGIQDETGDLAAMDAAKRRGIIAKPGQGVTPDELREILMQDGLLSQRDMLEGDAPQLGVSDLYEAIREELAGDLGHSRLDSGANARMEALNSAYGAYREMFGDDLVLTAEQEDLLGRLIVDDQMPMTEAMMRVARLARQGDSADIDARLSQAMDQGEAAPQGVQGDAARELGVAEVQRLFKEQTGQDLNLTPKLEQLLSRILGEVGGRADDALEQFQMRRPADEAQAQTAQPGIGEKTDAMRQAQHIFDRLHAEARRKVADENVEFSSEVGREVWGDGAQPYWHRIYNQPMIQAERPRLKRIIADHFEESQQRADRALRRLEDKLEKGQATKQDVKDIEKLREFTAMDRQELEVNADNAISHIMGYRLPEDDETALDMMNLPPSLSGPLKARTLRIPDTYESANGKFEDFLERDASLVMRSYISKVVPDLILSKMFGGVNPEKWQMFADAQDQAAVMRQRIDNDPSLSPREKMRLQKRLDKELKRGLDNLRFMAQKVRGRHNEQLVGDPMGWQPRTIRTIKEFNFVTKLGGMVVSSLTDMPRVAFVNGLTPFMTDGLARVLVDSASGFKKTAAIMDELQDFGVAVEFSIPRAQRIADLDPQELHPRYTKLEAGIGAAADAFGNITLMNQWNQVMKTLAGQVSMSQILKATQRVAEGRASRKDLGRLAASNISPEQAITIWKEFSRPGVGRVEGTLYLPNTRAWNHADANVKGAYDAFAQAVARDVDWAIITPGMEIPIWISRPFTGLMFQFKSFSLSSIHRTILAGLQRPDAGVVFSSIMAIQLGMMVEWMKAITNNKTEHLPETPAQWVAAGIDRSGLLGVLMDLNHVAERMTGGHVGMSALTGKDVSRFASRNILDALAGPTAGTVGDLTRLSNAMADLVFEGTPMKQSDIAAIRRLIPMQNVFYFSYLFQKLEEGVGEAVGATPTRSRRSFDLSSFEGFAGQEGQATMLGGEGMDQLAPTPRQMDANGGTNPAPTQVASAPPNVSDTLDVPRPEDDRPATLKRSGVRRNNTIPGVA